MWIGPLGPDARALWREGRGLVDVDSETGLLHVESVDLRVEGQGPPLELRRVHTDGHWRMSLDERIEISGDGVFHLDLDGVRLFEPDPPIPEGLAVDGMWPVGTTFGGGRVVRVEEGYEILADDRLARFDTDGRIIRVEDAEGDGMNYQHDELGLARVKADDGRSVRILHDLAGNISAVAAPGGEEHFYQWDGDRLVASIGEDGRVRFVHDDGDLAAIIWPDGSQVRVRYEDGRVVDIAGPGPLRRQLIWSSSALEIVDQRGASWRVQRDERHVSVTDPLGREARSTYGEFGILSWVAPDGAEVRLRRDDDGSITEAGTWRLRWSNGELLGLSDANGGTWSVERDAHGRLVSFTDPEGRTLRYERDGHGRVVSVQRGATPWRLERDARGHVVELAAPSGAVTHITRDTRGRITSIADPSGAESLLGGFAGDRPGTLLGRAGSLWVVAYDRMGRAIGLETPDSNKVGFRRDRLGGLIGIDLDSRRRVRIRYRSDGLLTRVEDALGQAWGIVGDAGARGVVVHRPDGTEVDVRWSPTDRLVAFGDTTIERDNRGNPVGAGSLTWTWDTLDRLVGVSGPGLDVRLVRAGAGFVKSVSAGELSWVFRLDPPGRVVEISSGDTTMELRRDANGLVAQIDGVVLERDDRGIVYRIHSEDRVWRALHDGEGRATRWSNQDGTTLSVGRDQLGRVELVRYPDGTLLRRGYEPGKEGYRIEGSDGAVLLDRLLTLDDAGRVATVTELAPEEKQLLFHRDPSGQLVAREEARGAWLWAPGQVTAPDGGMVLYDEAGRPIQATPPVGPEAWSTGEDVLSYAVDDSGCIDQVIGEQGAVDVSYDGLGRPVRISGPSDESRVSLEWDALGRLVQVGDTQLRWGLGAPLTIETPDAHVEVLHAPGSGWVFLGEQVYSLVPDDTGPRALVHDSLVRTWLDWSPLGFPSHDSVVPFGPGDAWVLGAGGPLVDGGGLIDPVSGRRSCAPVDVDFDTAGWPSVDDTGTPWWDPAPLRSDDVWGDPLGLLVALGELDPGVEDVWVDVGADAPPLPWLPVAAVAPDPPLFPGRNALPLGALDPLTEEVLVRSLPESLPLTRDAVLKTLVEPDLGSRRELSLVADALPEWAVGD